METISLKDLCSKLTIKEKIAQMLVFGLTGAVVDINLLDFIKKYGLGGLRVTPNGGRKFLSYIPATEAGAKSYERPPEWGDKILDTTIPTPYLSPEYFAEQLNSIRKIAFARKGLGLPMHAVADFEGHISNFSPPYMISQPSSMSLGRLGEMKLITQVYEALGHQIKAVGIDWIHSPVTDINVNPANTEISTRSFGADPELVTKCAGACIEGLHKAGVITSLKHYPGRGDSMLDAHFSIPEINISAEKMYSIHLRPYRELVAAGLVDSVMSAHTVYGGLDSTNEISTCSPKIIGILRKEFGFNGVITTDSMTMGGVIRKYPLGEACVRAVLAGCDLILMKAEDSLRMEVFESLAEAVQSGRISEERIDESLLRIWSLKKKYGLFENGGIVDSGAAGRIVARKKYRDISLKASKKVIAVQRGMKGLRPLKEGTRLLVIDQVIPSQIRCNNFRNYPGMLYTILAERGYDFAYVEYMHGKMDDAKKHISCLLEKADVLLMVADNNRNIGDPDVKKLAEFAASLGKPFILAAGNPYSELLIPDNARNVILTGGMMREQMEALADFLSGNKKH